MNSSSRLIDERGHRYGRLLVLEAAERNVHKQFRWWCRCTCGNVVAVVGFKLRAGHTKSCGCLAKEANASHHMCRSREYVIWQQMKERCRNTKKKAYARYGARGIAVCRRWQRFENFIADMGRCPPGLTLERVNNDKGYSPKNCKWATWEEQYRNRRQTVWIEFRGERLCRKDWCRRFNLDEATVAYRLSHGWPIERALLERPQKKQGILLDMVAGNA